MATRKSESDRAEQRKRIEQTIWRVPAQDDDPHYLMTSNLKKLVIERSRLRALLDLHGFTAVELPATREITAIQRALADVASDGEEVRRASKASDPDVTFTLATIAPDERGDKRLSVSQSVYVSYIKRPEKGEPNIVYSSADAEHALAPLVRQHMNGYTNADIHERVVLFVLAQLNAIDLRDKGGTYLVPAGATDTVKRLRAFVDDLAAETDTDCHLSTMALVNTDETRADVRFHSRDTLISEMKHLRTRLRDMLSARRVDEHGRTSVKPETVAAHLDELRALGQRAALYRDVAQLGLGELNVGLRVIKEGYDAVANGLTADEFDSVLANVERGLAIAESSRSHSVATALDAEDPFADDDFDPFADDAPAVELDGSTSAATSAPTTETPTPSTSADDFDPFAEDAPNVTE